MDTITQEKVTDIELQVMQQPLPALYIPVPDEKEGVANYLLLKRAFDVVSASVLLLAIFSWLYPLLYLLIRSTSKGGALFIQKRVGLNGKVFNCLKFRTMVINTEADYMEAQLNDMRITRIGKWLRNTYIDELPQLLNVLVGDMSIIGPRPHMLYHHQKFCDEIPCYNYRHCVKPGITGLSQVKGYHGSVYDPYRIHGRTKLEDRK